MLWSKPLLLLFLLIHKTPYSNWSTQFRWTAMRSNNSGEQAAAAAAVISYFYTYKLYWVPHMEWFQGRASWISSFALGLIDWWHYYIGKISYTAHNNNVSKWSQKWCQFWICITHFSGMIFSLSLERRCDNKMQALAQLDQHIISFNFWCFYR